MTDNEYTLSRETVYRMFSDSIRQAVTHIPTDVHARLEELRESETSSIAAMHLDTIFENCRIAESENRFVCPDTGSILYYVRIGDNVRIENGYSSLYTEAQRAVTDATADARLRPNMVHPLTRTNTGTNTGYFLPKVEIKFDPHIDFMEVIAVPKGGGSEIFGTFYRMMYPADGKPGIMKFVIDCIKQSTFAGATCPPNVIGIGIGGTADICMKIAKEAAVLRPIGSRHPEPEIAQLEEELVQFITEAEIGPMGMGGLSGVLDVHIEYGVTHTAALPVGFNSQCSLCRRKVARCGKDGKVEIHDAPYWEYRN